MLRIWILTLLAFSSACLAADRQALFEAVGQDLRDRVAKNVLADFLEEHGDTQAEYIRLALELSDPSVRLRSRRRAQIESRMQELLAQNEKLWVPFEPKEGELRYTWKEGVISGIEVSADWFRKHREQVFAKIPTLESIAIGSRDAILITSDFLNNIYDQLRDAVYSSARRGEIGAVNCLFAGQLPYAMHEELREGGGSGFPLHGDISSGPEYEYTYQRTSVGQRAEALLDELRALPKLTLAQKVAISTMGNRFEQAWTETRRLPMWNYDRLSWFAKIKRELDQKSSLVAAFIPTFLIFPFDLGPQVAGSNDLVYHLDPLGADELVRVHSRLLDLGLGESALVEGVTTLLRGERIAELWALAHPRWRSRERGLVEPALQILAERKNEAPPENWRDAEVRMGICEWVFRKVFGD